MFKFIVIAVMILSTAAMTKISFVGASKKSSEEIPPPNDDGPGGNGGGKGDRITKPIKK